MKKPADYTIREIDKFFAEGEIDLDFLAACRLDSRKAVGTIVRQYERMQKEKARVLSLYAYEKKAWIEGCPLVAGVDEAGRGPLAGPVSVAAVILPHELIIPKLNDSKKLSESVREELFEEIKEKAVAVSSILVDVKTIDRVNIYQATMNGMYDAVFGLNPAPDKVLIDAMPLENLPMPHASIVAKVTRDRLMRDYDALYPQYGFAHHKGYGTREHIEAIKKYGACPIHRMTFEPLVSMFGAK